MVTETSSLCHKSGNLPLKVLSVLPALKAGQQKLGLISSRPETDHAFSGHHAVPQTLGFPKAQEQNKPTHRDGSLCLGLHSPHGSVREDKNP